MNSFKFLIKCIANNEEFYAEKQNLATDSGLDLVFPETIVVPPNARSFKIPLGVCVEYPEGYYLYARSSIVKTSLILANSVGIIDAGYRGEIMAFVHNLDGREITLEKGKSLFQLCRHDLNPITYELVSTLSETERGTGGFGSTNK